MKFLAAATALAGLAVRGVTAQEDGGSSSSMLNATALVSALRTNNLNMLANVVGNNSQALLPYLMGSGNKSIFAPQDSAFQSAGQLPTGNALTNLIAYHIVNGTIPDELNDDGHTIVLSSLKQSSLANNRSQAIVLGGAMNGGNNDDDDNDNNNMARIIQPSQNITFSTEPVRYQNIAVYPIPNVLTIPNNITAVAQALNATMLSTLLTQTNLVQPLSMAGRLTVFAPTDAAIQSVQSQIMSANMTAQQNVLANHIINGTIVYSTQLGDDDNQVNQATSGSGQMLMFSTDDDRYQVRSGDVTANIIRSDNLLNNGVLHVIDAVLLNTASNDQAAASAASSASGVAATQTSVAGVSGNSGTQPDDSAGGGEGDDDSNDSDNDNANGGNAAGSLTVASVGFVSAAILAGFAIVI
ncbi:unnamed protein product [Jaminaea pallidilutea]